MLHLSAWPERDDHDTGAGHVERPARVVAALEGVHRAGLDNVALRLPPRSATRAELARVHTPAYLDWLEATAGTVGGHVDADTVVSSGSWPTALMAAGGTLAVVDSLEVMGQGVGLVLHRPPGHHATADQAMGFCLLNNVAIAAAALVARGYKVAVIDWDVHHGNGTEAIFWDEPRVLYVSTHQWPLYPGTGATSALGGPGALGANINIPLPSGATGDVLAYAFDSVVGPAMAAFQPDWALVSCGFDAHGDDPLGGLALSAGDFAHLAGQVGAWAPPGKVIVVLEGGYDLGAVARGAGAVCSALVGEDYRPEGPTAGGPGRDAVDRAREILRPVLPGV